MKTVFKLAGWVAALGLVGAGVLRAFFVLDVVVGHDAMAPTVLAGERVLVWRSASIELGDVVLCHHPSRPGTYVLGRVIARAGMTISTNGGDLVVSGTSAERDIQGTLDFHDSISGVSKRVETGIEKFGNTDHEYFVDAHRPLSIRRPIEVRRGLYLIGDYRSALGFDSRSFGEVDPASCLGTIFMRLWPAENRDDFGHRMFDIIR